VALRCPYSGKNADKIFVGTEGLKLMDLVFCGDDGKPALVN
jgi:hypothetical protein